MAQAVAGTQNHWNLLTCDSIRLRQKADLFGTRFASRFPCNRSFVGSTVAAGTD